MPVAEIVLDKEYAGPGIFELMPTIPSISDKAVKLRWQNTKDEIRAIAQFRKDFILYVADAHVFDRTVATFGKRIEVSSGILERAKLVLVDRKGYDWRHFAGELHGISPKQLLLKLAADAIRKGSRPSLAEIVGKSFTEGISPIDADVLIRLRSGHMRG